MRIKRKTKSKSKNKNKIKVLYQGTCASCNTVEKFENNLFMDKEEKYNQNENNICNIILKQTTGFVNVIIFKNFVQK